MSAKSATGIDEEYSSINAALMILIYTQSTIDLYLKRAYESRYKSPVGVD